MHSNEKLFNISDIKSMNQIFDLSIIADHLDKIECSLQLLTPNSQYSYQECMVKVLDLRINKLNELKQESSEESKVTLDKQIKNLQMLREAIANIKFDI